MPKFAIIDAFGTCHGSMSSNAMNCYTNYFEFTSESIYNAIELVKRLQYSHDKLLEDLINRGLATSQDFDHAPSYLNVLKLLDINENPIFDCFYMETI